MRENTNIAAPQHDQDFRLFLQDELLRRCKSNPKYSMRAFARILGLESSELSKILKGKRGISRAMFQKIASHLQLSPTQMRRFAGEFNGPLSRSSKRRTTYVALPSYAQLSQDVFQSIAEWYHYALLELINTKSFQPDARWIARRLDISVAEVNAATERLQRLQMLEISATGKWMDRSSSVTNIGGPFTNSAKKLLQKQVLEQALRALDDVPLEQRDHTSMTMAIDSRLLPEAREKITRFRRELCEFLQSSNQRDSVYQLGVALFPATKPSIHGEK